MEPVSKDYYEDGGDNISKISSIIVGAWLNDGVNGSNG